MSTLRDPVALHVLFVTLDLATKCSSAAAEVVSTLVELHPVSDMLELEVALSHL